MLPTELMSAIPAALAVPVKNSVGSVQKDGTAEEIPATPMARPTMPSSGEWTDAVKRKPQAEQRKGTTTCATGRRVPVAGR